MENIPNQHRCSVRLKDYDYSRTGAYFLTICTRDKECLFGEIINGEMHLNNFGMIVEQQWLKTPELRPQTELDAYVVMPNHFHAILLIDDSRAGAWAGRVQYAPTARKFLSPSQTLGAIIRGFKSAVTTRINGIQQLSGLLVWQRNYYEHIIRSEQALNKIREYISASPLQWEFDLENPLADPDSDRHGNERALENNFW
jgi:REP element-mobilizing transposase RayT